MEKNTITKINAHEEEVSIKEIIFKIKNWCTFLLAKSVVILSFSILGGIIGFAYAIIKKPIYKAELSFALEDIKGVGGLGGAAGIASQFGIDLGGDGGGAFSGDNLVELMKSRSMDETALLTAVNINGKNETLADLYISFNNLHSKWKGEPGLENIQFLPGADRSQFSLKQDSILGVFYRDIIKNNLSVDKADKKLSIISIVVSSENELFSKHFAEVLAKTVSDFYIDTKTKKSTQNVNILQHQTDSVRRELDIAINGVASSIDAIPNANPGRQLLHAPSQHKEVDAQADRAILTNLVTNLEIAKITLRRETPLIQVIDTPILPLEKIRVGKIKGFLIGSFFLGALSVIYLIGSKILKEN